MRPQEFKKLKALCRRYDLDWMEFDYNAFDYDTIKLMILKKAGVKTPEIEALETATWEATAEYYDSLAIEEKMFIPPELEIQPEFPPNILVIQLFRRHLGLALQLLQKMFKGNMMRGKDGEPRIERLLDERGATIYAIVWFIGRREVTDKIVPELLKHDIYPKLLRNYPLRRDFLHYHNGKWWPISRRVFRENILHKASIKEEQKLEKILKQF